MSLVDALWTAHGIPQPVCEYRFALPRKYRFDYAWIEEKVALEIEGGIWIKGFSGRGGAHSLPSNILRDMEKGNLAGKLGWRVFRFTPREFKNGTAQSYIKEILKP